MKQVPKQVGFLQKSGSKILKILDLKIGVSRNSGYLNLSQFLTLGQSLIILSAEVKKTCLH